MPPDHFCLIIHEMEAQAFFAGSAFWFKSLAVVGYFQTEPMGFCIDPDGDTGGPCMFSGIIDRLLGDAEQSIGHWMTGDGKIGFNSQMNGNLTRICQSLGEVMNGFLPALAIDFIRDESLGQIAAELGAGAGKIADFPHDTQDFRMVLDDSHGFECAYENLGSGQMLAQSIVDILTNALPFFG